MNIEMGLRVFVYIPWHMLFNSLRSNDWRFFFGHDVSPGQRLCPYNKSKLLMV
jgi:hypothetical protein